MLKIVCVAPESRIQLKDFDRHFGVRHDKKKEGLPKIENFGRERTSCNFTLGRAANEFSEFSLGSSSE
jgi:hypothetical protein